MSVAEAGRDAMPDNHLDAIVWAHPDGVSHRKACAECAFRRTNPQGLTEADFEYLWLEQELSADFDFYCIHREDEGCHRICACWGALRTRWRAAKQVQP